MSQALCPRCLCVPGLRPVLARSDADRGAAVPREAEDAEEAEGEEAEPAAAAAPDAPAARAAAAGRESPSEQSGHRLPGPGRRQRLRPPAATGERGQGDTGELGTGGTLGSLGDSEGTPGIRGQQDIGKRRDTGELGGQWGDTRDSGGTLGSWGTAWSRGTGQQGAQGQPGVQGAGHSRGTPRASPALPCFPHLVPAGNEPLNTALLRGFVSALFHFTGVKPLLSLGFTLLNFLFISLFPSRLCCFTPMLYPAVTRGCSRLRVWL